jgi:hypothetical protein
MPKEEKKVVFRRVRGRVVPIRVKDNQEKHAAIRSIAGGASIAAGGLLTALAGGKLSAEVLKKAAHFENSAREFAKNFTRKSPKQLELNLDFSSKRSDLLFRKQKSLRVAATAIGATLGAVGANKIREGVSGKKADAASPAVVATTAVAGAAASVATGAAFFGAVGARSPFTEAMFRAIRRKWK